ncbi:MAG: Synechococcus phage [Bacteroidota bacterium]|jgi:hypothetical protein
MEQQVAGYGLLNLLPTNKQIQGIEIGVDLGDTAHALLSNRSLLTLYGVDPYVGYKDWNDYELFQSQRDFCFEKMSERLATFGERFVLYKDFSDNAVDNFIDNSIDFIFIDGLHTYEQVLLDCQNYYPKLKSGGVFSFHDYQAISEVQQAITEFAASLNMNPIQSVNDMWYWIKP